VAPPPPPPPPPPATLPDAVDLTCCLHTRSAFYDTCCPPCPPCPSSSILRTTSPPACQRRVFPGLASCRLPIELAPAYVSCIDTIGQSIKRELLGKDARRRPPARKSCDSSLSSLRILSRFASPPHAARRPGPAVSVPPCPPCTGGGLPRWCSRQTHNASTRSR